MVVAMSLLGVAGLYAAVKYISGVEATKIPLLIVGYGFGASFVALFAQLGGGIYTKAADVASKLILNDKVDIMVALHTPDTVNPVTSVCERYQVPCVALDAPIEPWLTGGPYKWSFHAFWSVN
jgi:Na+/H+-translocating membrane pyrophosphatase